MSNVYNIVTTETSKDKEGNEKTYYTTVGVAFHNESSNSFSCKVKPGLALTGNFVLFEQNSKEE